MKKLLFVSLFLGFYSIFVSAQEIKMVTVAKTDSAKQTNFRHWAIAWNGGFCMLDGDFNSSKEQQIVPTSFVNFAFNAQVEYMITPIWGLYAQYSYLPWSGRLRTNINAKGISHDITLNGTFNILNLFRSNRSEAFKWGLNVNIGAGIAFYNAKSYKYSDRKEFINLLDDQYIPTKRTFVIPVGLSVEYNPTEWLGIFLQAEYRMYQTDQMEGITAGNSKDFVPYAGIGLKYKIGANKNRGHVKTATIMDYNPDRTDVIAATNDKQIDELSAQIDNITDILNNSIIPKLSKLEEDIDEIDSDLDGVPDNRDRHPNTPEGSFVNYYGEPLTKEEITKILGAKNIDRPDAVIYYEKNSAEVTPNSELAIAEIASKLYNNPTYKLEIYGYCDNTGNEEYNLKLSKLRAETIKQILIKQYEIEEIRITTIGKGKTKGPKNDFIVNRRADVYIVK